MLLTRSMCTHQFFLLQLQCVQILRFYSYLSDIWDVSYYKVVVAIAPPGLPDISAESLDPIEPFFDLFGC